MPMRIAGGLVVAADGTREADVVVESGRVAAIEPPSATGDIDARGCVVLPGGVDPHVHPLTDLPAAVEAATRGGTTTLLGFTEPHEDETPSEAFARAQEEMVAHGRPHPKITKPDALDRAELARLAAAGARSVKLFLAYPELGMLVSDRTLYETLRDASRLGMLVMVHCESSGAIEALVDEQLASGNTALKGFVASRQAIVEEEGVARTLAYARLAGAPVYLVHLTCARSLDLVREARRLGQRVWAEVCTHHLVVDETRYDRADAGEFLTVPPLRSREDVEALWTGIEDGTIDTIGSDHSNARYQPDAPPGDFRSLPYGFSGIGARMPAVLSEGRRRGVTFDQLADLLAGAPARAFGVAKGAVAVGADADLVVWDPDGRSSLEVPFADLDVRGAVRHVLVHGRRVVG
jgi:dihydropyrimidinase